MQSISVCVVSYKTVKITISSLAEFWHSHWVPTVDPDPMGEFVVAYTTIYTSANAKTQRKLLNAFSTLPPDVHGNTGAKHSNNVVWLAPSEVQRVTHAQHSYLKLSAKLFSEDSSPPVLSTSDSVPRNCSCVTATAPKIADGARAFWLALDAA